MGGLEYRQAAEIRDCFTRHGVRLVAALLDLGFDIVARKQSANRQRDRESLP